MLAAMHRASSRQVEVAGVEMQRASANPDQKDATVAVDYMVEAGRAISVH
jgi:hypothetical protein